jgi:GH15 family glucan-1,4-alpha-glucosidase
VPRDLPLSNGRLLVTFDSAYTLSDIYYPHIGAENHAYHCRSRIGVLSGSEFAWLDDDGWERSLRYAPGALVTQVEASSSRLQLALTIEDAVDFARDVFVRRFTVRNLADAPRDVRLYLHLDVAMGGNAVGDTVFFHPASRGLVAYKNVHYLLLAGSSEQRTGFDSWSTTRKDVGSWADFSGGELDDAAIAFGSVDCIGELRLGEIAQKEAALAHAWLAAGASLQDVEAVHQGVLASGPERLIDRTRSYWQGWVAGPTDVSIAGLPEPVRDLYRRSLLIARAQMDHGGAIIASPDSDIGGAYSPHGQSGPPITDLFRGHENYAYSWARDGALVAMALDNAASLYRSTVVGMANFLADYRDPATGLPLPSQDLWEERQGVHAFTIATVWRALRDAAEVAELFAEPMLAERYVRAAREMRAGAERHLYDDATGRFARSVRIRESSRRWRRSRRGSGWQANMAASPGSRGTRTSCARRPRTRACPAIRGLSAHCGWRSTS